MKGKNGFMQNVSLVFPLIVVTSLLFVQIVPQVKAVQVQSTPLYPDDLAITAFSGGFPPWTRLYKIEIMSSGYSVYSIMEVEDRDTGTWSTVSSFDLTVDDLNLIWDVIQTNGFFTLAENYSSPVMDGTFAVMTITANTVTHTVRTENTKVAEFDAITTTINDVTPGDSDLYYNAIHQEANPPLAPKKSSSTAQVFLPLGLLMLGALISGGLFAASKRFGEFEIRQIKLKDFSRSIKLLILALLMTIPIIDPVLAKTTVTRVGCNITVDIYIEFYSSGDPSRYQALVNAWETEIENMWNQGGRWRLRCGICVAGLGGQGCPITFDVHTKIRFENTTPTECYHQIRIVHDASADGNGHISYVNAPLPAPNGASGSGEWDDNEPAKTAAHEAGHLMGEDDQYTRNPDGSTTPKPNHANDIMGDIYKCTEAPLPAAIARIVCTRGGIMCPMECCPFTVGGEVILVDKPALLAPYIGLASALLVATTASAIYVKRVRRLKKKQ